MGGKTATSTQAVSVPPAVLAQYQSVNSLANSVATQPTTTEVSEPVYTTLPGGQRIQTGTQEVAQPGTELKPFQDYTGEFVAPVNSEQQSGIEATNLASGVAQGYYNSADQTLGTAQAGTTPVNEAAEYGTAASASPLSGSQINQYLSPYLGDVLNSTEAIQNQENQQAQAGQLGNAITSGAFGSDRTGIAAANLQQQEDLANANVISGIANTGYQSALGTAQGEQQIGLAGANQLASIGQTAYGEGANTASELGSLGSGAQSAALSGAQAQIGAGTVQQQTQQAEDTASYNQFLQQQSYPFQVAQFLANIAEGTGALSGSTTTTQQPGGFFSDERLKEDMEPIGKTFDGQPIYRYKIKGDPREQIGLSAQKVEKKHPDAVGLAGGFRYVDYGKATDEAANRGHFYEGGVVDFSTRRKYAYGGGADDSDGLGAVLTAQQNMYANHGEQQQRNIAGPSASHQLAVAQGTPAPPSSGSSNVSQAVGLGQKGYQAYKYFTKPSPTTNAGTTPGGVAGSQTSTTAPGVTTNSAGLETAAPTADTSGVGAADTSGAAGASEAAGTGAAEGASTAAAGSAAEGAVAAGATDAAVAGATDAAATEAAALAAEYAVADAAAAAAIAAKKGGRIRKKFADGGEMPYQSNGIQVDIPDDQQSNAHLQSPGPLVKQPTGLQTAMKMGDMNNWSSMAGDMFSNQGLARGGIAGRRGYGGGGATDDDPDTSPSAPSSTPPAAADDTPQATGVAPPKASHWWEKSENILPILSGLAAMGTAKTRSPGVALAAGLGAGADSYLNTRRSQATTEEVQQKAQGEQLQNQLAALKLGVAQKAFAPTTDAGAPPQGAPLTPQASPIVSPTSGPSSDAQQTADGLAAQYRHQFFVNAARTPEEQAAKDEAIKKDWAVGGTMFQTQADNDYQARVQRDQQNSRNTAQEQADARYAQYNNAASPADKQIALAHYNALRQWTGDEAPIEGGIVKNGRTHLPEIGAIAQQGFTPNDQASVMAKVLGFVDVPNSDGTMTQMPWWQANHKASPTAAAQEIMVNSTAPTSNAPPPRLGRVATAAPVSATAPPSAQLPSVTQGTTQSPIALEQQKMNLAALEQARAAGDQAPGNRNINQQLLQLSDATRTGPLSATVQKLAGAIGLPTGSRYQEINAYLDRQAATQASAMGVPHTNAGLAASQTATGTTEYTPQALQEKVKYADALNSGTMAYREGLDKAVGTAGTPNLQKYQAFRSAWAKNFDPDIYRAEDAQRRGDAAELNAIRTRLGSRGMKVLAQKSANLRALENGQIPP